MDDQTSTQFNQLTGRLEQIGRLDGTLARRTPQVVESAEAALAPRGLVPMPRRSRVFLRHGGEHGTFADLTVTAPPVRHTTD